MILKHEHKHSFKYLVLSLIFLFYVFYDGLLQAGHHATSQQQMKIINRLIQLCFPDDELMRTELNLLSRMVSDGQALRSAKISFSRLADTAEGRAKADQKKKYVGMFAYLTALNGYLTSKKKVDHLKRDRGADGMAAADNDPVEALKYLTLHLEDFTDGSEMIDAMQETVANWAEQFKGSIQHMQVLTHKYENKSWRNGLGPDVTLQELLDAAKNTVGSIDCTQLELQLTLMKQDYLL